MTDFPESPLLLITNECFVHSILYSHKENKLHNLLHVLIVNQFGRGHLKQISMLKDTLKPQRH